MTSRAERVPAALAALALVAALLLPQVAMPSETAPAAPLVVVFIALLLLAIGQRAQAVVALAVDLAATVLVAAATLWLLDHGIAGDAGAGYWSLVAAATLAAIASLVRLADTDGLPPRRRRTYELAAPVLFGVVICYLWEVAVRGFGVPGVLMPAPSAIAVRFVHALPVLGEDFTQTILRGVLAGYAIGCGAGLGVAILAHRFSFLGRGLLPLGNFVSALPIVGIAPIMVMWFGFDWQSKAAVVAVITFFPMLVNALAGLDAAAAIDRDLLRSYGANYPQSLTRLYLPAALPFIFNALKINSTLALIGAIVAEFFGTPTRGMGFRISIEVARMSLDMVWAEIALAAIAGMSFYALIAAAERAATFWHPSQRTS
jgi:NitT/TauT family transport system permease protein